jgi:hypothetical protein
MGSGTDKAGDRPDQSRISMPVAALQNRMLKLLGVPKPCPDDIRLLLIDTRVAIEHQNKSARYPVVWMYGNWCCHPELSRQPQCYDIIAEVQKAYERCKFHEREELTRMGLDYAAPEAKNARISPEPMNEFFKDMRACFRIEELRNELLCFYEDVGVDTSIIRIDANWNQTRFLIMHSVANKPLAIPETSDRFKAMLQESEREQLTPKKLFIEEKYDEGESAQIGLWWVIEMLGPYRVKGLLMKGIYPNGRT